MIATRFKDFNDDELNEIHYWLTESKEQGRAIKDKLLVELKTEAEHRELGIAEFRDVEAYYFGCVGEPGHYWWVPNRYGVSKYHGAYRDNSLTPWVEVDGTLAPKDGQLEGMTKLHHKDDWTAFSFWDRSVDHRGGSSSTFFFKAPELSFQIAVSLAKIIFPTIFARYTFRLTEDR